MLHQPLASSVGSPVVAVFAGHDHTGGFATDPRGVHHITLPSPLHHASAYGTVDVMPDRLVLRGGFVDVLNRNSSMVACGEGVRLGRTLTFPARFSRRQHRPPRYEAETAALAQQLTQFGVTGVSAKQVAEAVSAAHGNVAEARSMLIGF